jgi:hypothetical protein
MAGVVADVSRISRNDDSFPSWNQGYQRVSPPTLGLQVLSKMVCISARYRSRRDMSTVTASLRPHPRQAEPRPLSTVNAGQAKQMATVGKAQLRMAPHRARADGAALSGKEATDGITPDPSRSVNQTARSTAVPRRATVTEMPAPRDATSYRRLFTGYEPRQLRS